MAQQTMYERHLAEAMARRPEVLRLHDHEGLTFTEIGRRWGLTRARVHQIYKGAKDAENEAQP